MELYESGDHGKTRVEKQDVPLDDPQLPELLGDRLYTDIACAVNAGIDSVFVLSGEGTRDDIERDGIRPTWVYDDINAVFRAWEETP